MSSPQDFSNLTTFGQPTPPPELVFTPAAMQLASVYQGYAKALQAGSLPYPVVIDPEADRWQRFLEDLDGHVATGKVPFVQREKLLSIWRQARSHAPTLRRPAVGISSNGALQLSWAFQDLPAITFSLEIGKTGALEWFFRDSVGGEVEGTDDDPVHELPERAFDLLAKNFAAKHW